MEFNDIVGRYKRIENFPDYFITEFGDVYSVRLRGRETTPRLRKLKPKTPGKSCKYLNIILCNDECQKTFSIHRLVAEAFVGGYFDGAVVNHIDGNNRNNAATNLEWVTVRDNVIKSYSTSGLNAKRNYMVWELYDPDGNRIESFESHNDLERYIVINHIDASPSNLIKKGRSRGYTVTKTRGINRKL